MNATFSRFIRAALGSSSRITHRRRRRRANGRGYCPCFERLEPRALLSATDVLDFGPGIGMSNNTNAGVEGAQAIADTQSHGAWRGARAAVPGGAAEGMVLSSGGGTHNHGVLRVVGTTLGNEIHVSYTRDGVAVRVDGVEELFRDPVHTIVIDADQGDNIVDYEQLVVADIDLSILTGDGDDVVRVSFDLLAPDDSRAAGRARGAFSAARDQLCVSMFIDTGAGSDVVDIQWNSTALPALNAFYQLTANGTAGPEQADEVLVHFEHGDPDRPYVLGMTWNGEGGDRESGPDHRSLVLGKSFTPRSVGVDVQLTGGIGRDEVELLADYTGIRLQQGAVSLDADLNEGDNHFGGYVVSSARHMLLESSITAGDGDNRIQLENTNRAARETVPGFVNLPPQAASNVPQEHFTLNFGKFEAVYEVVLGGGNNFVDVSTDGVALMDMYLHAPRGNNSVKVEASNNSKQIDIAIDLGDGDNDVSVTADNRGLDPKLLGLDPAKMNASVRAGDGNNTVQFYVSDFDFVHQRLELGDGDNHAQVRFGDGRRGRRPPTSPSNVTANYRTGNGNNRVEIHGDTREPVAAAFLLDLGEGRNDVVKQWNFSHAWPAKWKGPSSVPGRVPSQTKVIIMGNPADRFEMRIEDNPPEENARKPAEFVIVAIGQKTLGSFEFQQVLGLPKQPVRPADEPIFVPVRRTFTMQDLSAEALSVAITDGDSSVALAAEDIVLKRGVLHSNDVAIESLTNVNEGWETALEGLDVFGSFSLEQEVHGRGSRTNLTDIHVHTGATAHWDIGTIILDTGDPTPRVSVKEAGLRSDGELVQAVWIGDMRFDMALAGATVHSVEWTNFNDSDPGITRSARPEPQFARFSMTDVHVSGWLNTSLSFGDSSFEMAMGEASLGFADIRMIGVPDSPNPRSGKTADYLVITLEDATVVSYLDTSLDTGNRDSVIWYFQEGVVIESGATMDVQVNGGDGNNTILALLREISIVGDGRYSFTADGGVGNDFIAVFARDLDPGDDGSMSFEVLGGDGDDTLALVVPTPTGRDDDIFARIDGGEGFNRCFATPNVVVENCDQHLSERELRRLLRGHIAQSVNQIGPEHVQKKHLATIVHEPF